MPLLTPLSLCFLLLGITLGAAKELRIYDVSGFVEFARNSSHCSYDDTVYLESDLDFSGGLSDEFEPINSFMGIFDGRGHTISNIGIKSSSVNVGLFGELFGVVKNLVMDSTCSVASNFTGSVHSYVGGIIGFYNPKTLQNSIANIVNMGNVTFEGSITGGFGSLFLGGIVGGISSSIITGFVKNCINYGTLIQSGTAGSSPYIGGVIGKSSGLSSKTIYIQNCLNYGAIIITDSSDSSCIGGILGENTYTTIENCVSAGLFPSTSIYKGAIIGYAFSNTNITHCLWTSDVGCDVANGTGTPSITSSSLISINATTVDELNEYASNNGWNRWLLNTDNKSVTFKINNNKGFSYSSQLILLPDIDIDSESGSGLEFSGWYSDPYCNELFTSSEIIEDTFLYGLYGKLISVSFDPNSGNALPSSKRVAVNGTYETLPEPTRTGYSFLGWFTENNEGITSETTVTIPTNHTLIAQWTLNNYTVALDVNGGDELKDPTKVVTFNDIYGSLPTPTRTGYRFLGWFTENNESVTSESVVSIPNNHTLIAQWEEVTSQVEIVFGTKDLTEERVKEIIREYTNDDDFKIIVFEEKDGEIRVVVKFADKEKADSFVEKIEASSGESKNGIRNVGFIQGDINSFSLVFCPIQAFLCLVF